jgi:putative transposase
MRAYVSAADVGDRDGAMVLLTGIRKQFARLRRVWADQAYRGQAFTDWMYRKTGVTIEIVQRADGGRRHTWAPVGSPPRVVPAFAVVPRRWVVERTYAWLGRFRQLSKDYSYLTDTAENVIYLAMSRILLHRLTRAP